MSLIQECNIKLARIREYLQREKLDGVFLKRQDDFAWLSCGGRNYVGAGDMGNCGLLVTMDGHYAITNNIEAPRMLAEEHLETLGFTVYRGVWHDGSFESKTLSQLVPSQNIGYDFGVMRNIAEAIKLLRLDLTQQEIDRYAAVGEDASLAMETAALSIRPGDTEYTVAGAIMKQMEDQGLELVSCMVAADERISCYRHPLPTDKRINGRVQIGGNFRRHGLVVCMTRYCNFEPISETLRNQYRANQIIDCTYIVNSIPGKSYQVPLLAGKKAYETLGYGDEFDKHHQGGPIGYAGRDYRVDFSTPGIIADHQGFCWNPSITGTKSEDTVITTKDGVIMISKPIKFPTVEIEVNGHVFVRPDILQL